MRRHLSFVLAALITILASPSPSIAQTYPTDDPVLKAMWTEGMDRSQTYPLAQELFDVVGPRLTGSPGHEQGGDWLLGKYESWGVDAEKQGYGTWMRWRRGRTRVDLVEPRERPLEAALLAWSPGTEGRAVRAEVVIIPEVASLEEFETWLPSVRGKFVAIAFAQPTCRTDADWEQWATEDSFAEMREDRTAKEEAWKASMKRAGLEIIGRGSETAISKRLEAAGAAGVIASRWSRGWGAHQMFAAGTEEIPHSPRAARTTGCCIGWRRMGNIP